jgi:hypothetical protein
MKTIFGLFALVLLSTRALQGETCTWRKTEHSLALLSGTSVVWQVVADPAEGKPYFHPLATLDGTLLADLRPADHPWHRGLWWSWKYINGLNYWEEDKVTHRSDAATELTASKLEPHDDGSAVLNFSLTYHPWNAPALLTEVRTVKITAPVNGTYKMDWLSEFTAVAKVTLDRTPPPGEVNGVSWGGYAGLSLRLLPGLKNWSFTNSEGASGVESVNGKPARWVKFSAGPDRPAVVIFDSPQNSPQPVLWYANQKMPYFGPALLYAKPLTLAAGEKLTLHYQITITDHDSPAVVAEELK